MYKCSFMAVGGAFAFDFFDLPTSIESEIKQIIEQDGYIVLEVFGVQKQK